MSRSTKLAKCPRCLPDVKGAIFEASYSNERVDGQLVPVWTCRNCGEERPRRSRPQPADDHWTPSQQRWLDRIATEFTIVEINRYGSRLWIKGENDARDVGWDGRVIFGSIGATGKVKLTLHRFLLGEVVITDLYEWNEYAPVRAVREARRAAEMQRHEEFMAKYGNAILARGAKS